MEDSRIKAEVLYAARPYLEGRTIKDLVIGISQIACQLSDDSVGISYVLRYGLPPGCSIFGYAQSVIGASAWEIANWYVEGVENLQRAIGSAVLSAASQQLEIGDDTDEACCFGMDLTEEDTLGMVGLIKPVADVLEHRVKKLVVFDESVSAFGKNVTLCKMEQQPELLPNCTKMIITGSSMINGTIDSLLEMCPNAVQIAMVGSSTPMFPEGFKGTKITALAGTWWKKEDKEKIFKTISLGGGIAQLQPYMLKKIAYVK